MKKKKAELFSFKKIDKDINSYYSIYKYHCSFFRPIVKIEILLGCIILD